MFQRLTEHLAAAVKAVDANQPIARNKRSGTPFAAGLGPHSENETFDLVVRQMQQRHPEVYLSLRAALPYPNLPRQRCDLMLTTPTCTLYLEGKLLRLKGDNGLPNDNMLMHILSPYPKHRSALTDCAKLANSGFEGEKAIVIIAYTYPDLPLEPAISAFEKLAGDMIGRRCVTPFDGLCHAIHKDGSVVAWPIVHEK
jgi:hypothetical protein